MNVFNFIGYIRLNIFHPTLNCYMEITQTMTKIWIATPISEHQIVSITYEGPEEQRQTMLE